MTTSNVRPCGCAADWTDKDRPIITICAGHLDSITLAERTPADADKALRDEVMNAFAPIAQGFHQWSGWPGTWVFADAAVRVFRAHHPSDESLKAKLAAAEAEVARLSALINSPHIDDFFESVKLEAAHQQVRHGTDHDKGKEPADWFWLIGYLAGKAQSNFILGNKDKGLHHIISTGAVLLNWYLNVTGQVTAMRPGLENPEVT